MYTKCEQRLSDFVTCRKRYYNQSRGLYLRFRTYCEVNIQYVNSSNHICTPSYKQCYTRVISENIGN